MTTRKRHLTSLAFAGALVLTSCGGGDDTAATGSGSAAAGHGGDHTSAPSAPVGGAAASNDTDIAFLTGMKPHHEQAVDMSDTVLAADPPAPVADLARQVKAAQAPEIEEIEEMLADLGQPADGAMTDDGMAEHGGMMSGADMEVLMNATGTEAARIYLEGMIEHHKGAIDSAETEIADGEYGPARDLAERIAKDQAAEITKMQALIDGL